MIGPRITEQAPAQASPASTAHLLTQEEKELARKHKVIVDVGVTGFGLILVVVLVMAQVSPVIPAICAFAPNYIQALIDFLSKEL